MTSNPFLRGYQRLFIEPTLLIASEKPALIRRPLATLSERDLHDDEIRFKPCVFDDHAALVIADGAISDDIGKDYPGRGFVGDVRYVVHGVNDQEVERVCDCETRREAEMLIQSLFFETGHHSRSWEISTAHITDESASYLAELADIATPTGFLFVAFRIPYSPAIGLKLIATPWTDENLLHVEGITADDLRRQHLDRGMPPSLADILHLAALADIRFLVFDADAPQLNGLPVYEVDDDKTANNA